MLERKYDVEIRFEDEALKREHLSGVFERESIGRVLQILQMTTGFRSRMEGRTIWVSKTKTII
jgi:ferric-dicitrate binding protein FerR (iron transport regulator)